MSASKTSSLQAYTLLLYRKAIHPEFFQIQARKRIEHPQYEFEGWVFKGGHAGRFQFGETCLCEVVLEGGQNLPDKGLVTTMPCAGEREFDEKFGDNLKYVTTLQTETLSEHLYTGTYREMLAHGRDRNCIMFNWNDDIVNWGIKFIFVFLMRFWVFFFDRICSSNMQCVHLY
jgi:hypothetical protein